MKAILIIEVDENADFENAIADITFRDNQWGLAPAGIKHWYNGIKLKPLPQLVNGLDLEIWNSTKGQILAPKGTFDEIYEDKENE